MSIIQVPPDIHVKTIYKTSGVHTMVDMDLIGTQNGAHLKYG